MAANFETVSTTTWASGSTTVVVNTPSGTVDDNLLIAVVGQVGGAAFISAPAGWTQIGSEQASGSGEWARVYRKVASSEGSSYTWTFDSTSGEKAVTILRFSGVDTASPINTLASASVSNDGTPSWSNSITPSTDTTLLMALVARQDSSGGASSYAITTSSPTWTERVDENASSSTLAVATGQRPESTATGNSSATLGSDDGTEDSSCFLIAIEPQRDTIVTHSLLAMSSSILGSSVSAIATVSNALLTMHSHILTGGIAKAQSNPWSNQTRPSSLVAEQNAVFMDGKNHIFKDGDNQLYSEESNNNWTNQTRP